MFFEPNREQAIRIQAKLRELYCEIGGEYYSGEEAWEYLKNDTGIDLKGILERIKELDSDSIDLVYMDPPFFTQKIQKLSSNEGIEFVFDDSWNSIEEYLEYISTRIRECKRVLKKTGSIFVHCDRNASHYIKIELDKIFGNNNFQSEIIWTYKRWSNSKKGLLNNHQVIFFYSKSRDFKFNKMYTDYSETTNVDQILQDRVRDKQGKSRYKKDENGNVVMSQDKKGVPLSDVWEIPYLNPKAKERVGYPTQKPIILLERIIRLVTQEGDIVLDPFAGSGTTLVAAKILNRNFYGIDKTEDAVNLSRTRLKNIVKTESVLLKKGKKAYHNLDEKYLTTIKSMGAVPVQRNNGIDGFLKEQLDNGMVAIRVQREEETLDETIAKIEKACRHKQCSYKIIIRTHYDYIDTGSYYNATPNLIVIDDYNLQIIDVIDTLKQKIKQFKLD